MDIRYSAIARWKRNLMEIVIMPYYTPFRESDDDIFRHLCGPFYLGGHDYPYHVYTVT